MVFCYNGIVRILGAEKMIYKFDRNTEELYVDIQYDEDYSMKHYITGANERPLSYGMSAKMLADQEWFKTETRIIGKVLRSKLIRTLYA
jgi:hypothetical protein